MATIDLATKLGAGIPPSVQQVRNPLHYAEVEINLATAATTKGSALAANDIIQAIDIPAQSVVLTAGLEVILANAGSSVLTLDLGVAGVDTDVFVDGYDFVAGVAGDFAQNPAVYQPVVLAAAGTVDIIIASLTTTNTAGKVRVFAWYLDAADTRKPGLTALKS